MTDTVKNISEGVRDPRHTSTGWGDCIVCVRQDPNGPALEVRQVIEGLSYHRADERVDIPILMAVRNPGDTPVAMRVVHRAHVKASLKQFCFRAEDSGSKKGWEDKDPFKKRLMDIMRDLYAGRLRENPDKPATALFHPRVNCLRAQQEPEVLSLNGPSGCFSDREEFDLSAEFAQGAKPSFSSYVLPPVAPGQGELFVLWLTVEGESYRRLVGERRLFTVDSHSRLLRQIKAFDVPDAPDEGKKIYCEHIEPIQAIIAPSAYDIVIFQGDLGDPIAIEAGSICILQVQPEDKRLSKKALWFYGQPEEFYLVLRYESAPVHSKPTANGFVVGKHGALV